MERGSLMQTFTTINDKALAAIIQAARHRLVFAAPGIHLEVAETLIKFVQDDENRCVEVVLDVDAEVCRLGYGVFESIERLNDAGVMIRKAAGLRIGVVISDESAWVFSPTPLVIEEVVIEGIPNAVVVSKDQAEELVKALCPTIGEVRKPRNLTRDVTPEIGIEQLTKHDLEVAREDLKQRPAQQLDLARQVRVYQSCIQFVELKAEGCEIKRHTVKIPSELMQLSGKKQEQDRLNATCKLIDQHRSLPSEAIQKRIEELRNSMTYSVGRYGRVMLKRDAEVFKQEVDKIRNEIDKLGEAVQKDLERELKRCKKELIALLTSIVKRNPPQRLSNLYPNLTKSIIEEYLSDELNDVIPSAEFIYNKMSVSCLYKDITYNVLNDPEFHKLLKADRHLHRYLQKNKLIQEDVAVKAKDEQEGLLFN